MSLDRLVTAWFMNLTTKYYSLTPLWPMYCYSCALVILQIQWKHVNLTVILTLACAVRVILTFFSWSPSFKTPREVTPYHTMYEHDSKMPVKTCLPDNKSRPVRYSCIFAPCTVSQNVTEVVLIIFYFITTNSHICIA
jgi:hypothetical protein